MHVIANGYARLTNLWGNY